MRIFLSVTSIVLLVLVIVLGGAVAWLVFSRQPYEQPFRPDAPQFGQRGAYTVGYQTFTVSGADRPLNIWVWYPAEGAQALANYSEFNGIFEASGVATLDANPSTGDAPYPLVIFSHGSGSSPLLSTFYTEHLASQGFVVIAIEHRGNTMLDRLGDGDTYDANVVDNYAYRPQDVTRVIDFALDTLNTDALSGMIDPEKIAISGHSFGGYTTFAAAGAALNIDALQAYCDANEGITIGDVREEFSLTASNRDVLLNDGACYLIDDAPRIAELSDLDAVPSGAWDSFGDPRINAIVALAPWNAPIFGEESLSQLTMPTLIMVGSNDNTTKPERDAINFYDWIGSDNKILVEFMLGDHSMFIDFCPPLLINFGAYESCSDPVWDLGRAHDLTNHLATAFLRSVYYDDAEATTALETENIDFAGVRVRQ